MTFFTPISNKFCIICCYYVCFGLLRQILWQVILLTYMSYKLVAHFNLSLDLFQGVF